LLLFTELNVTVRTTVSRRRPSAADEQRDVDGDEEACEYAATLPRALHAG